MKNRHLSEKFKDRVIIEDGVKSIRLDNYDYKCVDIGESELRADLKIEIEDVINSRNIGKYGYFLSHIEGWATNQLIRMLEKTPISEGSCRFERFVWQMCQFELGKLGYEYSYCENLERLGRVEQYLIMDIYSTLLSFKYVSIKEAFRYIDDKNKHLYYVLESLGRNSISRYGIGYFFGYIKASGGQRGIVIDTDIESVDNKKTVDYGFVFGKEVSSFLGDNPQETRGIYLKGGNSNILGDIVFDVDKLAGGVNIIGGTGSGKTVATGTIASKFIKQNLGLIYIERKGDYPLVEALFSKSVENGREADFYIVDASSAPRGGFTNSIDSLRYGSAERLTTALSCLINKMTGEHKRVTELALDMLGSLMSVLVDLRDMGLLVEYKTFTKVDSFSDLQNKGGCGFSFPTLYSYLNFQAMIDLVYFYRRYAGKLDKKCLVALVEFLKKRGVDCDSNDNILYDNDIDYETRKENYYAIDPWVETLETFGNPAIYGGIFNDKNPDISFYEAIRGGSVVIITLPSLQNNEDKNKKIGNFIDELVFIALDKIIEENLDIVPTCIVNDGDLACDEDTIKRNFNLVDRACKLNGKLASVNTMQGVPKEEVLNSSRCNLFLNADYNDIDAYKDLLPDALIANNPKKQAGEAWFVDNKDETATKIVLESEWALPFYVGKDTNCIQIQKRYTFE